MTVRTRNGKLPGILATAAIAALGIAATILIPHPADARVRCFRLRFPDWFSRVLLSALSVPVLPASDLLSCARLLCARSGVSALRRISIIRRVYAFGRLRAFRICAANYIYASAWVDQRARRILP
jgi:hypothetical protein